MVQCKNERLIGDRPDVGRVITNESRRPIVLIVTVDFPASLRDPPMGAEWLARQERALKRESP